MTAAASPTRRIRQARRTTVLGFAAIGLAASLTMPGCQHAAAAELDHGAMEQIFGEPVTDSATGRPQRVSDVPVAIEIVTQDDIRRSGAASIPDALQFVTGVNVRRYGLGDAQVGIRGYNQALNPSLLVLIDGRQVYLDDYGNVPWAALPVQLDEIRQIEVIKGPNSALYGFNAATGVINIITYDPLGERVNAATVRTGTQGQRQGSLVAGARVGDTAGLRISLGGLEARDFSQPGPPTKTRDVEVGAARIDGRVQINPQVSAFIDASLTDSRLPAANFGGVFDTLRTRTQSLRSGLEADTRFGLISVNAYRNDEYRVTTLLPGDDGVARQHVLVVQANDLIKPSPDHSVRVGLEYRDNEMSLSGLSGAIGYQVFAASIMWSWQITPAVALTLAGRTDALVVRYTGTRLPGEGVSAADYNRARSITPSFNAGLVWRLDPLDTVRLTAAQGIEAPSLVSFGAEAASSGPGIPTFTGSPNLRPTIVRNVEADYDRTLPLLSSTFRAAAFAQRTDDIIAGPFNGVASQGPGGILVTAANVGYSEALGVEVGLRGQSPSGWRWNIAYAFVTTTDHTDFANRDSTVDYGASVPRHVVTGGIGYTFERLEFDLLGRWQSRFRDFTANGDHQISSMEINNYAALNARIGYRVTDFMTVSLAAAQFNQSRLLQAAGPAVQRQVLASATLRF